MILEDGTIENGSMNCIHRLHKNRLDYEQITDDDCDDDHHGNAHNQEAGDLDGGSTSKRINGWRKVRAVMAYYYSLRKIKRNGAHSNISYFYLSLSLFNSKIPFLKLNSLSHTLIIIINFRCIRTLPCSFWFIRRIFYL